MWKCTSRVVQHVRYAADMHSSVSARSAYVRLHRQWHQPRESGGASCTPRDVVSGRLIFPQYLAVDSKAKEAH